MTGIISVEGVTYRYPSAAGPAILGANFTIEEGSFVLVAGETGAGKSTLLRAVNGLVPHFSGGEFSGRVLVGGRDTLDHAPRDLADLVAFVPQNAAASFVVDRVEDELAYAMENLGVPPATMRRRVEETLDLMAIAELRDRGVRALSGGERQRVAIAAALAAGPRSLVLDEPTSQLDPQGAEDVLAALQRLVHDMGLTVVIAEHRLERVAGFVDVAVGCRPERPPVVGEPRAVLEELRIGPPVARLGWSIGWTPVPLTVREARRRARSLGLGPPRRIKGETRGEAIARAYAVHAGYGRRTALAGIDFELRAGEVVALMGRNGAGKSTLLRCLCGLHDPARGRVLVAGREPRPGRDVALCPQEPETVLFKEKAIDEVRATLRASGRHADAGRVLDDFGVGDLADRHPRDLSAGERLLVAVAAIAATGARVLLLDEPTRGLDHPAKRRLSSLLRGFVAQGGGVVIATHDVELAAELAGRVVILAGGEVIAEGVPADVLGDSPVFAPQMARTFGRGWLIPEQVAAAVMPS
ncbi:MAG: ABC transporter ATP-binding protein [Actinomycetota bacterium]